MEEYFLENEELEPKKEKEEEVGFPCPHCGTVQTEYWIVGKLRTVKCPTCKKLIKQGIVPEQYIVHVGTKAEERKKYAKKLRGELEEEEEGVFVRPRRPEEILEGILLDFNLNQEFIDLMVRRSKNLGGIHPTDLRNYLKTLKSGIKAPQEADFIADEYMLALQKEERKAQELGVAISYPLYGPQEQPASVSSYPVSIRQPQPTPAPRYPATPYPYSGAGYERGYPKEGGLSREDIETMMRTLLFEKTQVEEMNRLKQQQEALLQSLVTFKADVVEAMKSVAEGTKKSEIDEVRTEIREQNKSLIDAMSKLVEKISDIGKGKEEKVVTVDKIESLLAKKELEAERARAETEKKLLETQAEMERKLLEQRFNRLEEQLKEKGATEKMIEGLKEEFNEMLEDYIKKTERGVQSDQYKSDEFRLVSDAVNRLANALEENKPIKEIKEIAVELIRGGEKKEVPEELKKKIEETASGVVDILEQIGKEYVSEE